MEAIYNRSKIESILLECLSEIIDISKETFKKNEPLKNYGLDSMDALQLLYDLGEKLNLEKKIEVVSMQSSSFDDLVIAIEKETCL